MKIIKGKRIQFAYRKLIEYDIDNDSAYDSHGFLDVEDDNKTRKTGK